MKTAPAKSVVSFTPRDLNRQPAKVLAAARKFGSVEVRTRKGETFVVAVKPEKGASPPEFPDFEARGRRLRALGMVPWPASENEWIDRIIAGEE